MLDKLIEAFAAFTVTVLALQTDWLANPRIKHQNIVSITICSR